MNIRNNISKTSKYIILSGLMLLACFNVFGQIDKEFWFAPPKTTGTIPAGRFPYRIFITTMREPAHVTVKVGSTTILNNFFINKADTTIIVNLTKAQVDSTAPGELRSIYIKSCEYIQAFCEAGSTIPPTTGNYCRDMYSLKGKNALGTSFIVPGQINANWDNSGSFASIHIVSAVNGNNITITPPVPLVEIGRAHV
jgi:hypothetical protein